ncbi:MAG TPA: Crp/Fnr family transcriptional regulator [Pyrinomonadaceae bacterium]|nr:Crp/Fnr family transcriptional regulator [Pyrinomonadaceae bacterium]
MPISVPPLVTRNRLLAALPRQEYERLAPHLEPAHLPRGKTIALTGDTLRHAYFPASGMISLLSTSEGGEAIEVAMVGSEGFVGVPIILKAGVTPFWSVVQIQADAVRISAAALGREFDRGERLRELLLKYTHSLLNHVAQSAVCNRFHTVQERLCRWLLVSRDRAKSDTINLTQEAIAQMLGTARTGVTMAAVPLQDAGLIRYRRGKITILDRAGLESAACECYSIVRKEAGQVRAA